jgi:hypothetical protein
MLQLLLRKGMCQCGWQDALSACMRMHSEQNQLSCSRCCVPSRMDVRSLEKPRG